MAKISDTEDPSRVGVTAIRAERFYTESRFSQQLVPSVAEKVEKAARNFAPDVIVAFDILAAWLTNRVASPHQLVWLGDLNFQTMFYHAWYAAREAPRNLRYLPGAWVLCQFWKRVYRTSLMNADRVLVASASSVKKLKNCGIEATYEPYPWPENGFANLPGHKRAPADIPTFVFFGSLAGLGSRSAIHFLFKKIYPRLPQLWGTGNFRILVAGRGEFPEWARRDLSDKKEIELLGFVDDLDALLRSCHAVLAPIDVPVGNRSRILTAMAKRVLVVAHRNAALGNPDLVDGETCYLASTAASFVERMRLAYEDDAKADAIIERAYSAYQEYFSTENASGRLAKHVHDIVDGDAVTESRLPNLFMRKDRSERHIMHQDLPIGIVDYCQVCASSKLEQVIDLGHQPPCNSLLTSGQLKKPETVYPLNLVRCQDCGLVQIDHVVPPEILFHPDYPYRSGITPTLAGNLQSTGEILSERFQLGSGHLAVDIGSNDGTLLKGFKNKGLRVLGVEATNISEIANRDGIETIQAFFNDDIARRIVEKHGHASVVTAANMFAHVPNLGQILHGVGYLLVEGGTFVTESHYLLDLLQTAQYNSIYHEHLKYYSIKPLRLLFDDFGYTVTDVERIPNYGGSIRVYAGKGKGLPVKESVEKLQQDEEHEGLYDSAIYDKFHQTVLKSKFELQELLLRLRREGRPAPGIGCPGRSSTLLNYCNIDPELMPYIAEQSSSLKLGLFLPGKHIPIVDEQRLFDEQPDYAVMLSWHYAQPIIRKLRERGLKSKIVIPLPTLQVIEN